MVHGRIGARDMTKVLETSGADNLCYWRLVSASLFSDNMSILFETRRLDGQISHYDPLKLGERYAKCQEYKNEVQGKTLHFLFHF